MGKVHVICFYPWETKAGFLYRLNTTNRLLNIFDVIHQQPDFINVQVNSFNSTLDGSQDLT